MADNEPSSPLSAERVPNDSGSSNERLRDLEELQQEVAKRIRDNERFLERFMDEDFEDEDDSEEGEALYEEL